MNEIRTVKTKRGDEPWREYRIHLADESAVRLRSASALRQSGATLLSQALLPPEVDALPLDEANELLSTIKITRRYLLLNIHHGATLEPEDFARIADFPELTTVSITTQDVSDEIAVLLAKLSALETLCVYSCRLSDRFLLPFHGHKSIRLFDVQDSRGICAEAVQSLAASLPSLEKACGATFGKSGRLK